MSDKISVGDFVTLDYVGRVKATGKVFDLTREDVAKKEDIYDKETKYGPVTVVVGAEHLIKGLDKELVNLKVKDKKKISIGIEDGFGKRDPSLVKLVPRQVFIREKINPMPGLPVNIGGQRGVIKTVSGGRIRVDFNHPLAGKELEYEVEVLGKVTKADEQVKSLLMFHVPKLKGEDVKISIKNKVAEITSPQDMKTRRYINLTEDIIAKDILKYIKEIGQVKFVDIFKKEQS